MDGLPVSWQHVPKQCCGLSSNTWHALHPASSWGAGFSHVPLRALGGQANRAQNANGEEATTVVAPKVLRQVVRQSFRCGNCLAGHGRGLVVQGLDMGEGWLCITKWMRLQSKLGRWLQDPTMAKALEILPSTSAPAAHSSGFKAAKSRSV